MADLMCNDCSYKACTPTQQTQTLSIILTEQCKHILTTMNKKFELMLTRCVKAYSSSGLVV